VSRFKLMVDSDFGPQVVDAVNKIGSNVIAKLYTDFGLAENAADAKLVAYNRNWVVLTHDHQTLNERRFPPCGHSGIIIVRDPRWFPETVVASLKALRQSGKAHRVSHHVTHLYPDKAIVHTHKGTEEIKL
jgi:hypothetical protein